MKGEFPIGWLWKDPKGRTSLTYSTEEEARDSAVFNAILRQKGCGNAFQRTTADERAIIWRGLQREGWEMCRPTAVFS